MPAKSVIQNGPDTDGTLRAAPPAAPTQSPEPSVDRRLDLLAAEIVDDALRMPTDVVERFDTQQQGE